MDNVIDRLDARFSTLAHITIVFCLDTQKTGTKHLPTNPHASDANTEG